MFDVPSLGYGMGPLDLFILVAQSFVLGSPDTSCILMLWLKLSRKFSGLCIRFGGLFPPLFSSPPYNFSLPCISACLGLELRNYFPFCWGSNIIFYS